MKRIVLLIFAISCSACALFAQGRVVVAEKNGNLTIGEIIEDNSEFIRVVKYDDKLTRIIYRSNIVSISDAGNKYKTKEELYSEAIEQARKEQEQKKLLQASEKKQLADEKQAKRDAEKVAKEAQIAAQKEAEAKAKAEEQTRIAAQKAAEAKAKAEEQARIAAQKEAEAKAKAEKQAKHDAEKADKEQYVNWLEEQRAKQAEILEQRRAAEDYE